MILVTGMTGHSGRYFLNELLAHNYEGQIRVVVREGTNTSVLDNCGLKIEKCMGDLSDSTFLDEAMNGVDEVLHIASIFYSSNVIKSAVKNRVKRAIFVHTTGIYSKYKSASEEYKNIEKEIQEVIEAHHSDINLIYLRPTMIYGYSNDRNMIVFIKMVDKLRLFPIISKGANLLQPVNGRDLGKAYYQLLMKKDILNGDYILSGEKPISMKEMFTLISRLLKKKTLFINVPLGIGVFLGRLLKGLTFNRIDYVERIQRMGEDRNFKHDLAMRDFGYSPMTFEEGLSLEVEEYLLQKNIKR